MNALHVTYMPMISYLEYYKKMQKKKKPNLHRQASASFLRDLWAVSYIKVAPIYMQNCSVLDILMITQLTENMQKVEETKNEETE